MPLSRLMGARRPGPEPERRNGGVSGQKEKNIEHKENMDGGTLRNQK